MCLALLNMSPRDLWMRNLCIIKLNLYVCSWLCCDLETMLLPLLHVACILEVFGAAVNLRVQEPVMVPSPSHASLRQYLEYSVSELELPLTFPATYFTIDTYHVQIRLCTSFRLTVGPPFACNERWVGGSDNKVLAHRSAKESRHGFALVQDVVHQIVGPRYRICIIRCWSFQCWWIFRKPCLWFILFVGHFGLQE